MPTKDNDQPTDAASDKVQKAVDKEESQGFFGTKVDPLPNEAYSLESGPDSPGVLEAADAALDLAVADRDSRKAVKKS